MLRCQIVAEHVTNGMAMEDPARLCALQKRTRRAPKCWSQSTLSLPRQGPQWHSQSEQVAQLSLFSPIRSTCCIQFCMPCPTFLLQDCLSSSHCLPFAAWAPSNDDVVGPCYATWGSAFMCGLVCQDGFSSSHIPQRTLCTNCTPLLGAGTAS